MADPDTTSFLVAFAAIWLALGLYLLRLHRRLAVVEREVARRGRPR